MGGDLSRRLIVTDLQRLLELLDAAPQSTLFGRRQGGGAGLCTRGPQLLRKRLQQLALELVAVPLELPAPTAATKFCTVPDSASSWKLRGSHDVRVPPPTQP